MRRREFIVGLVSATAIAPAQAQQTMKVYRIAFVDTSTPAAQLTETGGVPAYRAFFEELRRLGYVEGQNLIVERYSGQGRAEHYSELASDVVLSNPDLILAVKTTLVLDFKVATTRIPIVGITSDPIGTGIVTSLGRPGGNITGVSVDTGAENWGKRLELLREVLPRMTSVGFLVPGESTYEARIAAVRDAARRMRISLVGSPLTPPYDKAEYGRVFAEMAQEGADALVVSDAIENMTNRRLIVELAEKERLPAMHPWRELVELGGLMAYAIDLQDLGRRAADEIDLIFKGTKPGEIPYYQPTKLELSINLKTAKALDITIPPSLLARADEVIE